MQTRTVIFFTIIINILFSLVMPLYHQPINFDGILYIRTAEAYVQQGLHAATQLYPWPFYSVLLAKLSTALHLSLLTTGYILTSVFTSILVVFFILTAALIHPSPKTTLWAAAVILLFPELNHERFNILRDIGYYAFFMASIWGYIKFLQTEKSDRAYSLCYALAFTLSVIVASLFRIEGFVFLVLLPFIALFIKRDSTLILINLILALAGFFVVKNYLNFGRIPEMLADVNPHLIFSLLQQKTAGLQTYLGPTGQDDAGLFLLGGVTSIFIAAFFSSLGIFTAALLGYGIYAHLIQSQTPALQAVISYALINLIILCVFIAHQLFMDWRYMIPLTLLCLLFLPGLFATWNKRWIAIIYLLFNSVSSFGQFGPSNRYIQETGQWIAVHTPLSTKIYSTDKIAGFYSQRTLVSTPENADYVIIINKIHSRIPQTTLPNSTPQVIFHNNKGDRAYIFSTVKK